MSPLSIILLLPVKKCVWSESGEKSAQIKHCLQAKTALNEYVGGFWCERQQEMNFFIMDSYFGQTWWFENALMLDLFLANTQLFSSQDMNWWTGVVWITVDFCEVFISCLDSHSDGTHSLQSIHWWASDGMIITPELFWWRNKLILDSLRMSTFSANFHFWVNYSYKY